MDRAFEFQPRRAFSPYCTMMIGRWVCIHCKGFEFSLPMHITPFANMEMWLALVSASFSTYATRYIPVGREESRPFFEGPAIATSCIPS